MPDKKQNWNRQTFVSEAVDISKNLTYTERGGGPPSKTFTYDRFGGPLDHPLVSNWRFLAFKRIL